MAKIGKVLLSVVIIRFLVISSLSATKPDLAQLQSGLILHQNVDRQTNVNAGKTACRAILWSAPGIGQLPAD